MLKAAALEAAKVKAWNEEVDDRDARRDRRLQSQKFLTGRVSCLSMRLHYAYHRGIGAVCELAESVWIPPTGSSRNECDLIQTLLLGVTGIEPSRDGMSVVVHHDQPGSDPVEVPFPSCCVCPEASAVNGDGVVTPPSLKELVAAAVRFGVLERDVLWKLVAANVLGSVDGYWEDVVAYLDESQRLRVAYTKCIPEIFPSFGTPLTSRTVDLPIAWERSPAFVTQRVSDAVAKSDAGPAVLGRRGILPFVLQTALESRRATRALAKAQGDPGNVLDARQLALKLGANSVYGFTAANVHHTPEVSWVVTREGRYGVRQMQSTMNMMYDREGIGYVVYGDTDSVLVLAHEKIDLKGGQMGSEAVNRAIWDSAFEMERTGNLVQDVSVLEAEGIARGTLCAAKKYLMLRQQKPAGEVDLYIRGLQIVRREFTPMARDMLREAITIWINDTEEGLKRGVAIVVSTGERLLSGDFSVDEITLTKGLGEGYVTDKQPHVFVANKMERRNPGSGPQVGTRVPYVLCCTAMNDPKTYEMAEDPVHAKEHNVPLDLYHIFAKQMLKGFRDMVEQGDVTVERYITVTTDSVLRRLSNKRRRDIAMVCGDKSIEMFTVPSAPQNTLPDESDAAATNTPGIIRKRSCPVALTGMVGKNISKNQSTGPRLKRFKANPKPKSNTATTRSIITSNKRIRAASSNSPKPKRRKLDTVGENTGGVSGGLSAFLIQRKLT
jgi:hypothetical protein